MFWHENVSALVVTVSVNGYFGVVRWVCCNRFVGIRFSDSFFDVINHSFVGWHGCLA